MSAVPATAPTAPTAEDAARRAAFFAQLQRVGASIGATHDIDDIMLNLSAGICELFGADRLSIYALSDDKGSLVSKVKTGLSSFKQLKLPISADSIAGYAALSGKMLNLLDVYDEDELARHAPTLRFQQGVDRRTGYRTREMLGKAAGVGGAFIAAHETVIETLIQKARPYIFTTATPPALAYALLTSLDLIEGDEGVKRRAHLKTLVAQFTGTLDDEGTGLRLRHWRRLPSATAIQPILIGDNDATMRAGAALYEQGLWVGAIRPPTVAAGTARLRVTLSAGHSSMEVARLIAALNALESLERTSDES